MFERIGGIAAGARATIKELKDDVAQKVKDSAPLSELKRDLGSRFETVSQKMQTTLDREYTQFEVVPAVKTRSLVQPVGSLTVNLLHGLGFSCFEKMFAQVRVEDKVVGSQSIAPRAGDHFVDFLTGILDSPLSFPVTDVSSSVAILVWRKPSGVLSKSDKILGQVMIPLVDLLPGPTSKHFLAPGAECSSSQWYEVFPLPASEVKFKTGVDEMKGSAMDKPPSCLGFLHVELKLSLSAPVATCYTNTPIPPADETLDVVVIKGNITRILRCLGLEESGTYGILTFLDEITSWNHPLLSLSLMLYSFYVCLVAAPAFYFLHLTIFMMFYGYTGSQRSTRIVRTWNHQIKEDPLDPTTILGKLAKSKKITYTVQVVLGKIASVFEKGQNLLCAADPCITLPFFALLVSFAFVVGVLFSCFGFLLSLFDLNYGHVTCAAIVLLMSRPLLLPYLLKQFPFLAQSPAAVTSSVAASVPDLAPVPDSEGVAVVSHTAVLSATPPWVATPPETKAELWLARLSSIYGHLPDECEMAHRHIAKEQCRGTANPSIALVTASPSEKLLSETKKQVEIPKPQTQPTDGSEGQAPELSAPPTSAIPAGVPGKPLPAIALRVAPGVAAPPKAPLKAVPVTTPIAAKTLPVAAEVGVKDKA